MPKVKNWLFGKKRKEDADALVAAERAKNPDLVINVRHDREMTLQDLDEEAIGFFRTVLEIEPDDQIAKKYLEFLTKE